jgi:hypothetical protein
LARFNKTPNARATLPVAKIKTVPALLERAFLVNTPKNCEHIEFSTQLYLYRALKLRADDLLSFHMEKIRMRLMSKLILYLLLNIFAIVDPQAVNNGQYEFVAPLGMP